MPNELDETARHDLWELVEFWEGFADFEDLASAEEILKNCSEDLGAVLEQHGIEQTGHNEGR